MWASMFSYPPQPIFVKPLLNRTNCTSLNLRASLSDYPLASRIVVRNLSFSTHESRLQKEFSNFGEIAEVKLVKDELTKASKGYAFIQYTSLDDALLAVENMDRKSFDGRLIYVDIAKLGKEVYRAYPKTSGPPKKQQTSRPPKKQQLPEQDEVADCWY